MFRSHWVDSSPFMGRWREAPEGLDQLFDGARPAIRSPGEFPSDCLKPFVATDRTESAHENVRVDASIHTGLLDVFDEPDRGKLAGFVVALGEEPFKLGGEWLDSRGGSVRDPPHQPHCEITYLVVGEPFGSSLMNLLTKKLI